MPDNAINQGQREGPKITRITTIALVISLDPNVILRNNDLSELLSALIEEFSIFTLNIHDSLDDGMSGLEGILCKNYFPFPWPSNKFGSEAV